MKLLVFSPYYPPHTGGLESHSQEFNRACAERGIETIVFTPALPPTSQAFERDGLVKIIRYPAVEVVSNFPCPKFWNQEFWQLLRSLNNNREITHVISRTRFFLSSFLALVYARWHHLPLVHIEHGSDFVRLASAFKSLIARLYDLTLGQIVLRSSTANIAISQAVARFVSRFDKRALPIIYRGIDFSWIDQCPEDHSVRLQHPDKLIIATAARLYTWKGIETTLRTLHKLPAAVSERIVFLVIGDGEDRDRLKQLAAGTPTVFLGNVDRSRVVGLLKACDIYIHSSFPGGGLSTSLLEAMGCGCAVVASPHEGADEVISGGQNGYLFSAGDPEALKDKLTHLIENAEERERLSRTARHTVRQQFDWSRSIELYIQLLKQI